MLVLERKLRESIRIDGPAIITVLRVKEGRVKLGIAADGAVKVTRLELTDRPRGGNGEAPDRLPSIGRRRN